MSTTGAGGRSGISANGNSGMSTTGAGGRSGISANGNSGMSTTGAGGRSGISANGNSGMSTTGASLGNSHVISGLFSPMALPLPPTSDTLILDVAVVSPAINLTTFVGFTLSFTAFVKRVL